VTAGWGESQPVDMLVEMRKIVLTILTETLFKVDSYPDLEHLWNAVLKTIEYISPGVWLLSPRIPRPGYQRHLQRMDDYLYQIIARRRAALSSDDADLLGLLIASGMDDGRIRDQLLTMLIAGHDTSKALLAWALYLLTTHPDVMERVCAEVSMVLDGAPPTLESANRLVYLGQVIDETLRLYPPIHLGSRYVAEDTEFSGFPLTAGSRIMYSIYLTHHDPKYWEAPEQFTPDRFAPERKSQIVPYAYLPFGGGARNCIGTAFAQLESRIILARLLQRYALTFTGHRVGIKMGATLEPSSGVRVKVRRI